MTVANSLQAAALDYASRGWRVFPVKPRGKTPLVKGGFKAATVAPSQIISWWTQWPDANVGVATGAVSGLIVLDVDSSDGFAELERILSGAKERLPRTLTVRTSRGFHFYYGLPAWPDPIRCSSGGGLDVRGDGGYVLAPPSVHPDGSIYQWFTLLDEAAR